MRDAQQQGRVWLAVGWTTDNQLGEIMRGCLL